MRRPLPEDARRDVTAYRTADAIMGALLRHLMQADRMQHYGFAALRFSDGEQFLCLRGHQIGLTGDDASLWFRFGLIKDYAPTGNIAKFQRSGETVITIYCLDDLHDTDKAAERIIHGYHVHDVLIHEITHYLDSKRNPAFFGGKDNEDDGRSGYYNNPNEFNAYFTNLAYPLLHFLNLVEEGGSAERLASVLKISRDFKANLEMMVRRAATKPNGAYKRFYEKLDQRNRRALMKRLYALHQQVIAKLDGDARADA